MAEAQQSIWGNIGASFGGMTSKIFENVGEGSAYFLKNKIDQKLGITAADNLAQQDYMASAAYQRQVQTGVGRDWDGATLNDEFVNIGGLSVTNNAAKTGALVVGGLILAVLAFKLVK
jgi:hypothetical protein